MTTISIPLDEQRLEQLQKVAGELGVSVEQMIQQSIDSYLDRRAKFHEAADHVLQKNAELYRRLA